MRNSSFCSLNLIQPIIMSPHSERPHSLYYLTINNSQEEYLKLELPNHRWMYATKAIFQNKILAKKCNEDYTQIIFPMIYLSSTSSVSLSSQLCSPPILSPILVLSQNLASSVQWIQRNLTNCLCRQCSIQ